MQGLAGPCVERITDRDEFLFVADVQVGAFGKVWRSSPLDDPNVLSCGCCDGVELRCRLDSSGRDGERVRA